MPDVKVCPTCGYSCPANWRFCGNCGADVSAIAVTPAAVTAAAGPRVQVEDLQWRPRPGEIAARIEGRDLPRNLSGNLVIEEHTLAVILRDGVVLGQQGPGRYHFQSLTQRFLGWGEQPQVTAILIDSGEVPLEFGLQGLWTRDPLRLNATCRLVVQVTDAPRFLRNVLKDRPVFTVNDLRQLLFPELLAAADFYIGQQSMEELEAQRNTRSDDFAIDVRERLRDLFEQSGITFKRLVMFDLRHPRIDALRNQQEELFLGPAEFDIEQRLAAQAIDRARAQQQLDQAHLDLELNEARQRVAHRKQLFAVLDEEALHKIAEENAAAAQFEQRAKVWDRMRRAVQQDKLNAATTDEEWQAFVADADRRKLVRDDDLKRFRDELRWSDEDRQQERAHALAMAELQAQYERMGAKLSEQFKHDRAALQNQMALQREEILGRLDLRTAEIAAQLRVEEAERARSRAAEEERRAQARADAQHVGQLESEQAERERTTRVADADTEILIAQRRAAAQQADALNQARTDDEQARLQRQREEAEDEADLKTAAKALEMLKANQAAKLRIMREEDEERRRIAREDELARQQAAQAAERDRHERELKQRAQEHQQELDRMKALSEVSVDVLISLSGPQQAQILADLRRTDQLRGLSEEQILAMAVERNPEVIRIFEAKIQAASEGKLKAAEAEMYRTLAEERSRHEAEMRQQQAEQHAAHTQAVQDAAARETAAARDAADRAERMAKDSAERQERTNAEALRQMGDVARTYAQNQPAPAQSSTVILPAGVAGPTVVSGSTVSGGAVTGAAGAGAQGASGGEVQICPECMTKVPVGQRHCPNCGHQFFK